MRLRPATPDDIAFVAGLERAPSSEGFIARFEPAEHARLMADPANLYLLGEGEHEEPIGFAIVFGLDDLRHGNVLLKRIAVTAPGRGLGRPFVAAVVDRLFARPQTHRLWLTVAEHNPRARHVYEALGFVVEGRLREAYWSPERGRYDAFQMSLLRTEWEGRRGEGADGIVLRAYETSDAEAGASVFARAWAAGHPHAHRIIDVDAFRAAIRDREVVVACAANGRIVGFVGVDVPDRFVHHLYVDPAWTGRGVGRRLLARALAVAGGPATLKCQIRNEGALRFYARQGWSSGERGEDDGEPWIRLHSPDHRTP